MVNMNNDDTDVEVTVTNDEDAANDDIELADEEAGFNDKLKKLRSKLSACEEEKKQILDDSQRIRADFLNARKRIDEERKADRLRYQKKHVLELLPLCDSFQMAMSNKEEWEKADESWRKGIEGIQTQLKRILDSYGVKEINPEGEVFDPYRDEAVGTEEVDNEDMADTVVSVLQRGYEMTVGESTEVIRHARVTTGIVKK
jgi:molecular chaperone GrpE